MGRQILYHWNTELYTNIEKVKCNKPTITFNVIKYPISFPQLLLFLIMYLLKLGIKSIYLLVSSVTQSCLTLCDPMDCSMSGFPVHHQHLELTPTHVHWVGDAIQPSHPLSSPSLPAFKLSKHQGLFQWVNSSHHVTKVLEFQLQHQSFWILLGLTGWISLQFKALPRVFSNTTVQEHQFFGAQLSLQCTSYIHTWLLGKP